MDSKLLCSKRLGADREAETITNYSYSSKSLINELASGYSFIAKDVQKLFKQIIKDRSAGRSPLPPLSSRTVGRSVGPPPLPTRRPMPETRKPGDPGDPRTRRFSQKCAQARDVHWGKPFFLTPAGCFVGMGEKDKPCFFFVFSSRCRPASRTAKSSLIIPRGQGPDETDVA